MKPITMIQTFDGVKHEDTKQAKKHLDKLYSDIICKVSNQMRGLGYVEFTEYLDANLNLFVDLYEIKQDMTIQHDEL